jgi:hypothetical protein
VGIEGNVMIGLGSTRFDFRYLCPLCDIIFSLLFQEEQQCEKVRSGLKCDIKETRQENDVSLCQNWFFDRLLITIALSAIAGGDRTCQLGRQRASSRRGGTGWKERQ